MRFTVAREPFHRVMGEAAKIVPTHHPIPIMETVLLEVGDGELTVTATNLDVHLVERLPATDTEPGAAAVPCKTLHNLVTSLNHPTLSFSSTGRSLALSTGDGNTYNFFTFPAQEYTRPRPVPETEPVVLSAGDLARGISLVSMCAARDDPRVYLTGILLELRPGEMRLVASDSQRLALWRREVPIEAQLQAIMLRSLAEFVRGLDAEELELRTLDGDAIYFSFERGFVAGRLFEGPYAPYESVIPQEEGVRVKLSKAEFLIALKRLAELAEPPGYLAKLTVEAGGIRMETHSARGSAREVVPGEVFGGEVRLGVEVKKLAELVRAVDDPNVVLSLYGPDMPFKIEPGENPEREELLYLMMSLRAEEDFLEE